MQTNSIIATVAAQTLLNLTSGELKEHAAKAAREFASFSTKGCKYFGVLRHQLIQTGETEESSYKLLSKELEAGGMPLQAAKSAVNNGNGHMKMALYLMRTEGPTICEDRFYAVPVAVAGQVAATLKKGGDEAIRAFNKIGLKNGKLNKKSLAAFLPQPKPAVEESVEAAVEESDEETVESTSEEVAARTPAEEVLIALKILKSNLPKLNAADRDAAISALAKMIG